MYDVPQQYNFVSSAITHMQLDLGNFHILNYNLNYKLIQTNSKPNYVAGGRQ